MGIFSFNIALFIQNDSQLHPKFSSPYAEHPI